MSSTIGTLSDSENLMPFLPNLSLRVSGTESAGAEAAVEEALIIFEVGTEKERREAMGVRERMKKLLTASTHSSHWFVRRLILFAQTVLFGCIFWTLPLFLLAQPICSKFHINVSLQTLSIILRDWFSGKRVKV